MIDDGWHHDQRRHMAWLATPKSLRQPRTKTEWADVLGVNRRTLIRWEKLPGFMEEVSATAGNVVGEELAPVREVLSDNLPEILQALADKAREGDLPAVRLFLEAYGSLHLQTLAVSQPQSAADDSPQLGPEEIEELARLKLEEWHAQWDRSED